jgi:hypothetical protein
MNRSEEEKRLPKPRPGGKAEQMIRQFLEDLDKVPDGPTARAKREPAEVLPFPPKLSDQELWRRQQVLDATWERVLAERRELEAEAERSFHVGPGDPDWRVK